MEEIQQKLEALDAKISAMHLERDRLELKLQELIALLRLAEGADDE